MAGDAMICSDGMTEWVKAGDVFGRPSYQKESFSAQAFETSMGVGGLFGRVLLLMFGTLLVIPAPWVITDFYKWFIAHLQLPRVSRVEFTGNPADNRSKNGTQGTIPAASCNFMPCKTACNCTDSGAAAALVTFAIIVAIAILAIRVVIPIVVIAARIIIAVLAALGVRRRCERKARCDNSKCTD